MVTNIPEELPASISTLELILEIDAIRSSEIFVPTFKAARARDHN
jgi:hypothetical protein